MIGYCFLGSILAANHKRLKTEGGKKCSRLVHFPLSSIMPLLCLKATENPYFFPPTRINNALKFIENRSSVFPNITFRSLPCMFRDGGTLSPCSFQQTKGGLFFPGCNLSVIMPGMEQVLSLPALIPTSVMTSLSVIQSNPQSCLLGALRVMALVLLSSPILPPPFPSLALKLPLLELLSCLNRYNLRRLPVLRWDGMYLSRLLFCAQRIKSYPTMHPVTRDAGLAR